MTCSGGRCSVPDDHIDEEKVWTDAVDALEGPSPAMAWSHIRVGVTQLASINT